MSSHSNKIFSLSLPSGNRMIMPIYSTSPRNPWLWPIGLLIAIYIFAFTYGPLPISSSHSDLSASISNTSNASFTSSNGGDSQLVNNISLSPPRPLTKEEFIQRELDNEFDGPYDLGPLTNLCATRSYQPGLVVKCYEIIGGMGNIRNEILNCIRFALEGGATGLIVPQIELRDPNLWEMHTGKIVSFTWMFNLPHFLTSLATACPQVTIYLPDAPELESFPTLDIDFQGIAKDHNSVAPTLIINPSQWRPTFDDWLRENAPQFSDQEKIVLAVNRQLLRFPLEYDEPRFVATYGRLLLLREDVRRLGAAVLWALSQKFELGLEAGMRGVQDRKFFGIHLRTESDALKAGWPGYEYQAPRYLDSAIVHGIPLIYLTSGNATESAIFNDTASSHGLIITDKEQLLASPDMASERQQLEDLPWDLKGVIDYLVLLKSSFFAGVYESSFAWSIVNRRRSMLNGGKWKSVVRDAEREEWDGDGEGGGEEREEHWICYRDELSEVMGWKDMKSERWQFPWGLYP